MASRTEAVSFAMDRIMCSTDWQEVADALLNDGRFDDLLQDDDAVMSIVRAAEDKLGSSKPEKYCG
jgi:hypothetical protein